MPRGGHNKKHHERTGPPALEKWPAPPKHFTKDEVVAWSRVGEAAMVLGSVCGSDLIMAERLAQIGAKVNRGVRDPEASLAGVAALMRLEADLLNRMGLSPQARNTIGPLSKPKPKTELDEF